MAKQTFNISIEDNFELNGAIERAVEYQVREAIRTQVDEAVKTAIQQQVQSEVESMVHKALRTKVQIFNYDGSVKDERSFEDAMKAALKEINEQGVSFKIKTGSYPSDNKTVADVIKDDYTP